MATFTTSQRERLSEEELALPDGSYPIRNRKDLKNAIASYGRAKDKAKVKRWIIKRARALNATDLIPESWEEGSMSHSLYLQHYGVKGMKWGVRKSRKNRTGRKRGKRRQSSDHRTARKIKKKRLSEMSNQEINAVNRRMRLENEYRSLRSQQSVIKRGHKKVQAAVAIVGTATAVYKLGGKLNKYLNGPGSKYVKKGAAVLAKRS